MAVSHAAGRWGLARVGARIVPWRQLAIGIINVSDRLTAPPARARPLPEWAFIQEVLDLVSCSPLTTILKIALLVNSHCCYLCEHQEPA
jgi:hypothetical protein